MTGDPPIDAANDAGAPVDADAYLAAAADLDFLGGFIWEEMLDRSGPDSSGGRVELLRKRLVAERRLFARSGALPADRLLVLPPLADSGPLATTIEAWRRQSWQADGAWSLAAPTRQAPCPSLGSPTAIRDALPEAGWVLFARPGDVIHPGALDTLNRRTRTADAVIWSLVSQADHPPDEAEVFRVPRYDRYSLAHAPEIDTCVAVAARVMRTAPEEVFQALLAGRMHSLLLWLSPQPPARMRAWPAALTVRPRRAQLDLLDFISSGQGRVDQAAFEAVTGQDFGFDLHPRAEAGRLGSVLLPRLRAERASVIIALTRQPADAVARTMLSILRQQVTATLDFVLVGEEGRETHAMQAAGLASRMAPGLAVQSVLSPPGGSFYARLQQGAQAAASEVLVFCGDDTLLDSPSCLEEACAWALQPEVGAVGCRLSDPAHRRQEMFGYAAAWDTSAGPGPLVADRDPDFATRFRSCAGHSLLFCAIVADRFRAAGQLNADDWNGADVEVEFFLRLGRSGLHNLYLGHLRATAPLCRHYEIAEPSFGAPDLVLAYPESVGLGRWGLRRETIGATSRGSNGREAPHSLYLPEDLAAIARAADAALSERRAIQAGADVDALRPPRRKKPVLHALTGEAPPRRPGRG